MTIKKQKNKKRIDAKLKTDKGNKKYQQYAKELDDIRRKMVFLKR